uniref:EF-hand domain-containing protein n=1 Tax=Mesocestoides corti TaxID=53468 RepID=A0A5K3FTN3_MESCO
MAVQGFLDAFKNIDKDKDRVISHEDLRMYASEKGLPDSFSARWIALFDSEHTGTITFDHFCEVLGLNKKTPASPGPIAVKETVEYKCTLTAKQKADVNKKLDSDWKLEDPSGSIQQLLMYMDKNHGVRWRSRLILDEKNIPEVDAINKQVYAFSPDGGAHKYLIWRQKEKRSGGCCACFV